MKKTLGILVLIALLLSSGCKNAKPAETKNSESLDTFDTSATIEPTVIYDKDNIKIAADELTYGSFSAELSVTIENNSDKDLSFICGSSGYSVNSVNGCMIDDGYINCDVAPGESAQDIISIGFNSLNMYGITKISDMEIGFDISDDDYNSIYTGPLQIKTSVFDSYDYSVDRYQEIINNGALENAFNCDVNYFSSDVLYDSYNVRICSSAVITNVDGETALLLEIENNSNGIIYANTKDMYINGCPVYDSLWSSDSINAGKKYLVDISLSDLADEYEGNKSDMEEISEVSFTFSIGENWYEPANSKKISISLPKIKIATDEA